MKKRVIVNATALRESGGLTILLQFISEIPNDEIEYYVFVHKSVVINKININTKIIHVDKTSFIARFIWDLFGLNLWLKTNKLQPDITISLQNTNFRVDSTCPNFVYYHQSIPFYNLKWSVFKKNERNLWFYKNIYPFFVKLFINKKTEFFVQLNYIKDNFHSIYKVENERIHVVFPKIEIPTKDLKIINLGLNRQNLNLFYPATNHSYKNHEIVFKALKLIDNKLNRKIDLYLTNTNLEFNFNYSFINIDIKFLGKISFSKVYCYYKNVDCLLFPSYMETLGLPLIEAASCGLKIIAADLPYAREVLRGYKGVTFAKYDDARIWSELILLETQKVKSVKYDKFMLEERASWGEFFNIIKQNSNV